MYVVYVVVKVETSPAQSARDQLFGNSPPASPSKPQPPSSPVFKSAAAQEIIKEIVSEAEKYRRAVPKEKRRHVTISSSRPITMETSRESLEEVPTTVPCAPSILDHFLSFGGWPAVLDLTTLTKRYQLFELIFFLFLILDHDSQCVAS
jgi:hypothetical protein